MEDLQEVARLILLQVDHNRECGKDDKFTKDEIADIINRRVVKKLTMPAVIKSLSDLNGKTIPVRFTVKKEQLNIYLDDI